MIISSYFDGQIPQDRRLHAITVQAEDTLR